MPMRDYARFGEEMERQELLDDLRALEEEEEDGHPGVHDTMHDGHAW